MCGPLGYQGSKAAMKVIAEADVVLALGTRLGPFGTLPQHGIDYWPKNAKIIQVDSDHRMLGLVKQISVGVCGDAKAAGRGDPDPAGDDERGHRLPRQQGCAPGRGEEAEGCLGGRAQPMGPGRRLPRRAAPRAARAGEGHAEERHGHHRHRQYLLGLQQLSALRGAAQLLRRHELRQLRLCLSHRHRRQGGRPRPSRRSPMSATAPGA